MARIPIGLQLYSVRHDCEKDLPGTLKAVAEMGYEAVEFAGYYDRSAEELRGMLDDMGLKVCGTHAPFDTLLGDELEKTIEFNRIIGNKFLIAPSLPQERRSSKAAWLETAGIMNGISAKLEPLGMFTGYHNHNIEFTEMDGELPWDIFFGATDERVVMQVDTGNGLHGGADMVPYIERYPGRALTVHLKEYSATDDKVMIGEGDVRWDDLFRLCESVGKTEWYIVEQECYRIPPLETVDGCLKALKDMGK